MYYPDFFLVLIKYLQTFGEETYSFLKAILHSMHKLTDTNFSRKIDFTFVNSGGIFLSTNNLKINTYIEFYGVIKKISCLKTINSKLNIYCNQCGLVFSRNLNRSYNNINKMFNLMSLSSDRKFHSCLDGNPADDNRNFPAVKLYKEFTCPFTARYMLIENISNDKSIDILCFCKQGLLSNVSVFDSVKISGIVKTRRENKNNSSNNIDNFYEKIIEVLSIEKNEGDAPLRFMNINRTTTLSPILNKYQITLDDISKFEKLASYNCINTYMIVNLLDPKISSNFELLTNLLFYFLFSEGIGIKSHIIDASKSDGLSSFLKNLKLNLSNIITQHDLNIDNK